MSRAEGGRPANRAAADYSLNGAQISLRTSLVGVTLDILILLALSSSNARYYAAGGRSR